MIMAFDQRDNGTKIRQGCWANGTVGVGGGKGPRRRGM